MRREQFTICGPIAARTPPAAPPPGRANRGSYVAGPKTSRERLEFLEQEARRILAAPEAHRPEEIRWARDMVATTLSAPVGRRRASIHQAVHRRGNGRAPWRVEGMPVAAPEN